MYKLVSTTGDQAIDLQPGRTFVVGRAVTSDVPIYDPTISRRHAEIFLTGTGVRVKDLESANGTWVNGNRVTEAEAGPSDLIKFGRVEYRVKEVTAPAPIPSLRAGGSHETPLRAPSPGTIVRQLPVSASGGVPAIVVESAQGESHIKLQAQSLAERREKKLSLLLEISKELSKTHELDSLLDKVVDFTFQIMNVDRVSILLLEERSGDLVPRVSRSRTGDVSAARHVPQSIARKAVEERVAILADNAAADDRFKGKSILIQSVRSAMCAPLLASDQKALGILYVDNQTTTTAFTDEDLEFLIGFSGLTAVAIENSQLSERIRREAIVLGNLQRFFAPDVAAQIAQHDVAVKPGGEKRPVVIFFSDIRGFTKMSENRDADVIAGLLTEYFTVMVDIVFEHGGTLDKFTGDGMMALWGAPLAHADDADRAVKCALQQLEALDALNAHWKAQPDRWKPHPPPHLEVKIGINFGEVFVGNFGSNRRLEYTVIGDAVNTASRLCDAARPDEILISQELYKKLRTPPKVEALEPIQVKGKSKPLTPYHVKR